MPLCTVAPDELRSQTEVFVGGQQWATSVRKQIQVQQISFEAVGAGGTGAPVAANPCAPAPRLAVVGVRCSWRSQLPWGSNVAGDDNVIVHPAGACRTSHRKGEDAVSRARSSLLVRPHLEPGIMPDATPSSSAQFAQRRASETLTRGAGGLHLGVEEALVAPVLAPAVLHLRRGMQRPQA